MKRKIICLVLSFMCLNQVIAQEVKEIKSQKMTEDVSETNKKIEYEISISKGNILIYKNTILLNSTILTPLLFAENNTEIEKSLDGIQISESNLIGKKQYKEKINQNIKITLMVKIGKDGKKLWSNFLIEETNKSLENSLNIVIDNEDKEKKNLNIDNNPSSLLQNNEIVIPHVINKQTIFNWNNYNFEIKAKY